MAYTKYSLTPADNNAAPPNGAPEGMLPSAVNDTMRDMMSQIRDVGDGIRGGTYTMTAPVITGGSITGVALSGNTLTSPVITGGSINNTTVGATTRSTGAFTTLASNGATTFTAGTASTSTTTGTAVITGGLGVSGRINAANFDGIVGANTAAAGNFTTLGATGVATFSAGTVSAPAITTTGDTNTGIFFPAADTIAFTEGGAESMRITSAGNVGIGTTAPTAKLHVTNTGSGDSLLIEDSTNPDNTPFVIDSSGVVITGYTQSQAIAGATYQYQMNAANPFAAIRWNNSNSSGLTALFGRSRSATVGTNSIVVANDSLGNLAWVGDDGATFIQAASISAAVDGTPGTNDMPGRLVFSTTADGSSSPTERMRIDSAGNVGIGTSSPSTRLNVIGTSGTPQFLAGTSANAISLNVNNSGSIYLTSSVTNSTDFTIGTASSIPFVFFTNNTERMRIDSSGQLLVGKTSGGVANAGFQAEANGSIGCTRSANTPLEVNRLTNDGTLVSLLQDSTQEGSISVSGTTVSYNGGHLARWSQLPDGSKDDTILKGTVMSNLDDMCVWEKDGVVADNEQLNKMKVSDVEGDTNVAGVFVNWTIDEQYGVDDMNVAMTGDMIIRIADGVVVQKGDLLMSAGDGTAKPQGDDIVRSKTIAKVTSNYVTCTYADGSYCVPCVLMAC